MSPEARAAATAALEEVKRGFLLRSELVDIERGVRGLQLSHVILYEDAVSLVEEVAARLSEGTAPRPDGLRRVDKSNELPDLEPL